MWEGIAPWLASGGGAGIAGSIAWLVYKLHLDAVRAEQRRADDARDRAKAAEARADLREEQMGILLRGARDDRTREPIA